MSVYMHTVDGKPGVFDGEQICYLDRRGNHIDRVLRPNLATIRREQRASVAYRMRCRFSLDSHYDYIRLTVGAR